jgi:hypothetical protein
MDDKEKYMRWLEEMWNVQRFDTHGSTEREEERTEEVLEVFRGLVRLSRHRVEPPDFPTRGGPLMSGRRLKRPQKGDSHAE